MNLAKEKQRLIDKLVSLGYLKTPEIIRAFESVPREEFVPRELRDQSYVDEPLPIGEGQTISQPLTVAAMTEALEPKPKQKILEIGAGSGYQAVILSEIVGPEGRIITIERNHKLAQECKNRLTRLGYKNILVIESDGTLGYESEAPYDRIIVTASAPHVPEPLKNQLKTSGVMVIPVGLFLQTMHKLTKIKQGNKTDFKDETLGLYQFVPLIGRHGFKE